MAQNTWQNGKTEKSDNIKLSYAREEAGTQEPRDVWTCGISACLASHWTPLATTGHAGYTLHILQTCKRTPQAHCQGKPGFLSSSRMPLKTTHTTLQFTKIPHLKAHLERGLERPQSNLKAKRSEAESGWGEWRQNRVGRAGSS